MEKQHTKGTQPTMTQEESIQTDPQTRFQDFLKHEKYRKALSQMTVQGQTSITVDFDDVLSADTDLAENTVKKPDEYLSYANKAAYAQLQIEEPEYAEQKEKEEISLIYKISIAICIY